MKILILGGTRFLGRALADQALSENHQLTLLHRGKTGTELFPEARKILGDRREIAKLLAADDRWDVVIDTSGYHPSIVRLSCEALADRCTTYLFISTISVYRDYAPATGKPAIDESSPTAAIEGALPSPDAPISGETYGALKRLCEEEAERAFGARALIVRPGMIIGPHDGTNRFHWWIRELMTKTDVPVPNDETTPFQGIDVRDLARWCLRLAADGKNGVFNAVGPAVPVTFNDVLRRAHAVLTRNGRSKATLIFEDPKKLEEEKRLGPYWVPKEAGGIYQVGTAKALAHGLLLRPLEETITSVMKELANGAEKSRVEGGV